MIQVVRLEYHDEDDAVPRTAFADVSYMLKKNIYFIKLKFL